MTINLTIKEKLMVDLTTLANQLAEQGKDAERGFPFEVNPIPSEVEVLQIIVEDEEELPIFVSASEEQILCIAYLFKQQEVKAGHAEAMNLAMLAANISMPLSSFAVVDDQYVIYGALSVNSSLADIVHEIEVLSSNTIEAIEAMHDYLD
jgi:uncharacterized protein YjfI (DUF2170 family)